MCNIILEMLQYPCYHCVTTDGDCMAAVGKAGRRHMTRQTDRGKGNVTRRSSRASQTSDASFLRASDLTAVIRSMSCLPDEAAHSVSLMHIPRTAQTA